MKDVIIRLNGGLGNQMFQYAFAKAIARRHGARLLVDRSMFDLSHTPERYRLDAFDIAPEFTGAYQNFLTRMLLSPKIPTPIRKAALATLSMEIVDEEEFHGTGALREAGDIKPASRRTVFVGYFQRFAAFAHLVDELRDDFRWSLPPGLARQTLHEIESTQSVAVHVRRGDYVEVPLFRRKLGMLSPRYYEQALALIREKLARPTFFVFTDDPVWARREIVDGKRDVTVVDHGADRSDLADLALMRACAHFIVANSTFSWWPAFLADRPDKIVIAPKPWFIEDDLDFEARVPASWTALDADFIPHAGP